MTTTPPPISDLEFLALLDRAESASLTSTHLRFLLLIRSSTEDVPMASPTVIATRMKLSVAAVSEIAKLMRHRKLIVRSRNHIDDRRVTYQLTQKSLSHLEAIRTGP